jgi:hypothetical protein
VVRLVPLASGGVDLYVEQEVGPRKGNSHEGIAKNRLGSALFVLDAELGLYRNCGRTAMREFRRKQRNLKIILFLRRAGVKVNRKFLFGAKKLRAF